MNPFIDEILLTQDRELALSLQKLHEDLEGVLAVLKKRRERMGSIAGSSSATARLDQIDVENSIRDLDEASWRTRSASRWLYTMIVKMEKRVSNAKASGGQNA